MTAFASRQIARVAEPDPFGDVTLAPASMTGHSEGQLAREMARAFDDTPPTTAAQALRQLRSLFPDSPLAARVAALNAFMRR